ncbi:MAG: nucleoside triphosphate pyrophosphohydrolase family protein [Clostridiales bacterium]|nr:nucleoside triphosphate pyrophosphohydrolase family protein [Clostridiales bacterium]
MTPNKYQKLAARTIPDTRDPKSCELHALYGMVSEVGELHGIYQKSFQGHEIDPDHVIREVGDILWFIAEYCTSLGWKLEDVMQINVDKLLARYPNGFEETRSLHRSAEDI